MPKGSRARRAGNGLKFYDLAWLATVAGGIYVFGAAIQLSFWRSAAIPLLVISLVIVVGYYKWSVRRLEIIDRRLLEKSSEIVAAYLRTRRYDNFGNLDESGWRRQADLFIRTYAYPRLSDPEFKRIKSQKNYAKLYRRVEKFAAENATERGKNDISAHAGASLFSPREYELHCAQILQSNGWNTKPTQQTRDSGADLIASLGEMRAVIECKRHNKPVGNRAVQQIYTAKRLYAANLACVVAPNGFTRQAEQEAMPLGVLLLHHSELPMLAKRVAVAGKVSIGMPTELF